MAYKVVLALGQLRRSRSGNAAGQGVALTNALCDPDRRGEAKAGLCSFARSGSPGKFHFFKGNQQPVCQAPQLGHQVRLTDRSRAEGSPRPMEMIALWDLTHSSTIWLPPVKLFLKSDKAAKSLRKWTKQTLAGLDLTPCRQAK